MENNDNQQSGAEVFTGSFIKIFLRLILIVFIITIGLILLDNKNLPEKVKLAQDTLSLHYLNNQIYKPTSCRTKLIDENYFVLCSYPGRKIGGLYLIEYSDTNFIIHPVNGKAIQHTDGFNIGSVTRNIDIQKVFNSF